VYLNETYSKVRTGKLLSDKFHIQNGLKRDFSIATAFQFCFRICHQENPRKSSRMELNGTRELLVHAYDVNFVGP
jgi:hypothetical protein